MALSWRRFVSRFVPAALLPRRRSTEHVLRDLYQRQTGASLDEAFRQAGMSANDVKRVFDEIDRRYGESILSGYQDEMNYAVYRALGLITTALGHQAEDE